MTEHQHPITPPFELVEQWIEQCLTSRQLAAMAFQAGADHELEACVDWLDDTDCEDPQEASLRLRRHRRPKPPSLKELALTALTRYMTGKTILTNESVDTIRRALEALPE